jgi:hypothetical protein
MGMKNKYYVNIGNDLYEGIIDAASESEAREIATAKAKESLSQTSAGRWCLANVPEKLRQIRSSLWYPDTTP